MNEMVERVARAIVSEMENQQLGTTSPWHDPEFRDDALRCARAAIAAMREPIEAMLEVGEGKIAYGRDDHLDQAWRAMIDACLKDEP